MHSVQLLWRMKSAKYLLNKLLWQLTFKLNTCLASWLNLDNRQTDESIVIPIARFNRLYNALIMKLDKMLHPEQ